MNLISILSDLEENEDLHAARLLILLKAFAGRSGEGTVDGLTKLAKLDFLLRYPVYLERALIAKVREHESVNMLEHERKSVESSMVRFKFGPWDFRYRRFINLLLAKGLAQMNIEGRTVRLGLTDLGMLAANDLSALPAFKDVVERSRLLKRHFDLTATNIMKFVYKTFPEIASLRLGEEIDLYENQV
jgi:hypothetical protein